MDSPYYGHVGYRYVFPNLLLLVFLTECISDYLFRGSQLLRWYDRCQSGFGYLRGSVIPNLHRISQLRFLAGFFPGVMYYLSMWYPTHLRATRMAIFSASIAVAGAFGGLIATGVSFMSGLGNLYGWQWL